MLIIFTFAKNIARLWKWVAKINEMPRWKLNYFSWVCVQPRSREQTISLIIVVSLALISFNCGFGNSSCSSNNNSRSNCTRHTKKHHRKKCEKEILMKFMTTESNYATTQLHTHWTALISTSMTMQLANSGILTTVPSRYLFSLLSVCRAELHLHWPHLSLSLSSNGSVIIFDNFSDMKIAHDKLP